MMPESEAGRVPAPDAFMIGAPKCGTTALADALAQHPGVHMSVVKEPFYFVDGIGVDSEEEYRELFRDAPASTLRMEASTGYLFAPEAPARIRDACPEARLVVALRHPVDLAFSLWAFERRVGNEDAGFEEALAAGPDRERDPAYLGSRHGWAPNYLYRARASFAPQLSRWLACFPREQFHVVVFEDFKEDPARVTAELYRFLGLREDFTPVNRKVNVGGAARSRWLTRLGGTPFPLLKRLVPVRLRQAIRVYVRNLNVETERRETLPEEARVRLYETFADDVRRTGELLGLDLDARWRGGRRP